jgi:hypothetical protein
MVSLIKIEPFPPFSLLRCCSSVVSNSEGVRSISLIKSATFCSYPLTPTPFVLLSHLLSLSFAAAVCCRCFALTFHRLQTRDGEERHETVATDKILFIFMAADGNSPNGKSPPKTYHSWWPTMTAIFHLDL